MLSYSSYKFPIPDPFDCYNILTRVRMETLDKHRMETIDYWITFKRDVELSTKDADIFEWLQTNQLIDWNVYVVSIHSILMDELALK